MWINQVLEQSILLMCHHPFIARAEFRILAKWETWIRFPNNSVINLTFSLLTFSPTLTLSSETPSEWRLMKRIHYGLVIICSFSLIHTHTLIVQAYLILHISPHICLAVTQWCMLCLRGWHWTGYIKAWRLQRSIGGWIITRLLAFLPLTDSIFSLRWRNKSWEIRAEIWSSNETTLMEMNFTNLNYFFLVSILAVWSFLKVLQFKLLE